MTWITAALVVAAALGLVNVIDSHLISKRMPSLWAFLIPAGIIHLGYGLIFLTLHPLPGGVEAFPWFVAVVSAVTRTVAVLLMLYAMRTEEISRIIPVVHTQPVFVAILAVPLLGEALNYLQWLAIVMTVAGAVLISARWGGSGRGARLRKTFILLLASSLLFGVSNIATKYALDYISFWNMYSVTAISLGIILPLVSARPRVFRELRQMKDRGIPLMLIAFNETIALGAIILSFWAMARGPVSLVSTVMGARPFFVFLYALALSHTFPAVLDERLSRGIVALKIVSIALIVGGVAIINLVD
ncbi:MAG: DMT family transporter [Dehalococcoidia bacterium]|nr:MAG: DMT family transporter [Dehalococcoidia bacterium]